MIQQLSYDIWFEKVSTYLLTYFYLGSKTIMAWTHNQIVEPEQNKMNVLNAKLKAKICEVDCRIEWLEWSFPFFILATSSSCCQVAEQLCSSTSWRVKVVEWKELWSFWEFWSFCTNKRVLHDEWNCPKDILTIFSKQGASEVCLLLRFPQGHLLHPRWALIEGS